MRSQPHGNGGHPDGYGRHEPGRHESGRNGNGRNGNGRNGNNEQARNGAGQQGGAGRAGDRGALLDANRPVLITGGAGFIGTNLAARFAAAGQPVLIFDNLSRDGVARNLEWLVRAFGSRVSVETADVRDERAVRKAVARACRVYHFAAQVAVTTSLVDPRADFAINACGALNVLEALRELPDPPPLLFTSTNKVYGNLRRLELIEGKTRYAPANRATEARGVDEGQPLDFHSPYGCSKGAADQYVLDYARCFGLPAVVFRMSCIYGPHQCGNEDQGWVAHFLLSTLRNQPITIYGDGKQVRDILFVDDLAEAMATALDQIEATRGKAFNLGGGPHNSVSLLELLELIEAIHGRRPQVRFAPWREADQRYYVSDVRCIQAATDWKPRTAPEAGLNRLYEWLRIHRAAPLATVS